MGRYGSNVHLVQLPRTCTHPPPRSGLEGLCLVRPCQAVTSHLGVFWRAYPTALYDARRNREAGRELPSALLLMLFLAEGSVGVLTQTLGAACMENPTPEPRSGTDPAALSVLVVLPAARTRCPARDRHDTAMGLSKLYRSVWSRRIRRLPTQTA